MTTRLSRGRRLAAIGIAFAAVVVAVPSVAHADAARIEVLDAAGKADPVIDVGRTFRTSGNVTTPKRVYVKFRPAGGAACAPSFSSDSGDDSVLFPSGLSVNGDFSESRTGTWRTAGAFQFCIWLADSSSQAVTPISQVITFRAPAATVSATVTPIDAPPDTVLTATVTGTTEAPRRLYAKIRPAGGAPCAGSFSTDTGDELIGFRNVDGAFTETTTFSRSTAGDYLMCLWVAQSSDDAKPVAGPQAIPFRVVAPPPPCVVPSIVPGSSLATALAALTGASCTEGPRRYQASTRFARGSVIKTTVPSGTTLANGAQVSLLLSSGRPCVVPRASRGVRLSGARSRLLAAGCTPGRVTAVRSARARGTLVRFVPGSGTRLSPRASVRMVFSRGRR